MHHYFVVINTNILFLRGNCRGNPYNKILLPKKLKRTVHLKGIKEKGEIYVTSSLERRKSRMYRGRGNMIHSRIFNLSVFKQILLPRVERWYSSFEFFFHFFPFISPKHPKRNFHEEHKAKWIMCYMPHLKEALRVIPTVRKMDTDSYD